MESTLRFLVVLSCCLFFWNCPGGKNVKTGSTKQPSTTNATASAQPAAGGCIKGRVVNEDGKGFSGVLVSTDPKTSPEVTDSNGFFELCHRRKVVNAETGETAKVPIQRGKYVLKFQKDGYHARPVSFDYSGAKLVLSNMVMVEKTRPLPSVVETKRKEEKRTSGVGGKAPISE